MGAEVHTYTIYKGKDAYCLFNKIKKRRTT